MTVDRAAIFHLLTLRQARRREVGLKPLDMTAEYRFEVALAVENDFRDYAKEHDAERLMIREQVIADFNAQHGKDFRHSTGGVWAINAETNKRFRAHLWFVHGIGAPPLADRHPVTYGGGGGADSA